MTPLAQAFARDMLETPAKRKWQGEAADFIREIFLSAHFFEVTGILDVADELIVATGGAAFALEARAFLPARVTWLEAVNSRGRWAAVLVQGPDDNRAHTFTIIEPPHCVAVAEIGLRVLPRNDAGAIVADFTAGIDQAAGAFVLQQYGLLNLINRPGSLHMRDRPAHKGLVRDLTRRGMVGRFPLHGFTEITLNVAPGGNMREPKQVGTSADRCLHFVRAHLRHLGDSTTVIPWHWRGDPALGIKNSRYNVVHEPDRASRFAAAAQKGLMTRNEMRAAQG